jgi:hypothetical protein
MSVLKPPADRLKPFLTKVRVGGHLNVSPVFESEDISIISAPTGTQPTLPDEFEPLASDSPLFDTHLIQTGPDIEYYKTAVDFETRLSTLLTEEYQYLCYGSSYSVNFASSKWAENYDASVSLDAHIPTSFGTVRCELRIQGHATYDSNPSDKISYYYTATNPEQRITLLAEDDWFLIPDNIDAPGYPLTGALIHAIYKNGFGRTAEAVEELKKAKQVS